MSTFVPTLSIAPKALEVRLRPFIEGRQWRPVLERMLANAGGTTRGGLPPEGRFARVLDSLAALLAGSPLQATARPLLDELGTFLHGPQDAVGTVAFTLDPPADPRLDDLERWLQLAPDTRAATAMRRQIGLARELDWTRAEDLLVETFERHLVAPDGRTSALAALQAITRVHALLDACLLAHVHAAWTALERDLHRAFIALDASQTHHTALTRWRDLPKTGEMRVARHDGFAEIITPDGGGKVGLRLDLHEIPTHVVMAIRYWRSWHGLRHWAALQRLFTVAGRTGRIRWNLNDHLVALGLAPRSRREPRIRRKIAAEVEALTRLEIAVYNRDGSLRMRGPILAVTQRGEALRGSEWALEGLELVIHPALYEGVRKSTGELGRLWAPAPAELAHIDERTHPYALALGLILPIRWRWDLGSEREHLVLTGEKLLETAGIQRAARNPGRAWQTLDRNLKALQAIGGVGHVVWEDGERHTLHGRCHLHPPAWVRDRLVHHLRPQEEPRSLALLTGADLIEWRRSLGLTQAALAAQLAVSERTVRRAEKPPDRLLTPSLREALDRFKSPTLPALEA